MMSRVCCRLFRRMRLDEQDICEIRETNSRYIILENDTPMNLALGLRQEIFRLVYRNQAYSLWEVLVGMPASTETPASAP